MLQRFEFTKVSKGENVKRYLRRNFDIFSNKNDLVQCLVVFSIVLSLFSAIRSLLSELSLFEFPLLQCLCQLYSLYRNNRKFRLPLQLFFDKE